MSNIFLFTGQGAQAPGMGEPFMDTPLVTELFTMASDITGIHIKELLTTADEETLKKTHNTQVAIAAIQAASTLLLKEKGVEADITAGFSLGEIAAYWEGGILSTEEFFKVISLRGKIMQEQSVIIEKEFGTPGMAAVMGLDKDTILETISPIDTVYGANYNSPIQTVIAGTMAGIEAAIEPLKAAGAKRVIPLKVSGPFHTPLMAPAAEAFGEALQTVSFQEPKKQVYANATAGVVTSAEEAVKLLQAQIISPVRWTEIESTILASTTPSLVAEVGPGKVLAGLWKGVDRSTTVHSLGTPESIEQLQ